MSMSYVTALKKTSPSIMDLLNTLPEDVKAYVGTFLIGRSSYAIAVQEILKDAHKFLKSPDFYWSDKFHRKMNRILYYKNRDNPGYIPTIDGDVNNLKKDIWSRILDKTNSKSVWNIANLTGTIYVNIFDSKDKYKYDKTSVAVHTGPYSGEMFGYDLDTIENIYRRTMKKKFPLHPHAKANPSCRLIHPGFTEIRVNKYCTIRQNDSTKQRNPNHYYFERPFSVGSYAVDIALHRILKEVPHDWHFI